MTTEFDKLTESQGAIAWDVVQKKHGMDKITFGQSLRAFRKCEAWTLAEAANKLGISAQLLSAYETGKRLPSLSKVVSMADVFGTEPSVWVHYRVQDEMRQLGFESTVHINLHRLVS